MKSDAKCQIAVIGMGCYYPGAKSPLQLWENILARRQQFRQMPDIRLPNSEYYDPDPSVADKTYLNKAAVLDGYSFNWLDKRIPKNTFESTDIVHWLALDTALQALADARYQKDNILHDTTGVVIGNTLTGEFTRSNTMLLRWPYVRKVLHASLKKKGLLQYLDGLEYTMEKYYKSVFAPVSEDTLAGGLANTIAGRVCNYLDLHGGGYIVDGACASSLLAICTAANYLELGQMDMVIAGGVDISLDTFEMVGFAKTGALTHDEMRVYDKQGKGFIPGEGCGMVILKRLEDAMRDKDQVYAIIKGWGIASDGKGGITAPSPVGQSRALLRAYEKAGIDTADIDFIEGHGTGTTVGDRVELEGINLALNHERPVPYRNCGVTSFKSIVGHTKAAAGVGAFIKTVIALNRRILPPTAGLKEFNPILEEFAKTVYPIMYGQIRNPEKRLMAGVSAMGFGGINSHILLESGDAPSPKLKPFLEERKLMVSDQSSELFLLTAQNIEELALRVDKVIADSLGISYAELADYASYINHQADYARPFRAAIVAYNPFDLERKLSVLKQELEQKGLDDIQSREIDSIVFGPKKDNLRIGALYPGQGAQRLNMTFKLVERHSWARDLVSKAREYLQSENAEKIFDAIFKPTDRVRDKEEENEWREVLKQTDVAQPAIILASLLWHTCLERLGIPIHAATGHSLGELMSFFAAGAFSEENVLKFAAFRGKSMAESGSGTMASLVCSKEMAEEYLKKAPGYVTIANINAPEQTVISGETKSIRLIIKLAEQDHIGAVELPVSAAFHSSLVSKTASAIRNFKLLQSTSRINPDFKLVSSVWGKTIGESLDLNSYFSDQAVNQVNFIDAIHAIKTECDVLVEVGPGKVLSGLTSGITHDVKCFAVEARSNDDFSLNVLLANVFVRGANINVSELYADRLIRDFIPAYQRSFIVNPLERPFPKELENNGEIQNYSGDMGMLLQQLNLSDVNLDKYIALRGNFIREVVMADLRYFQSIDGVQGNASFSNSVVPPSAKVLPETGVKPLDATPDFRTILVKRIEAATGFPSDGFVDSMRLLDDFNLDSIKAGTLLADLSGNMGVQTKINVSDLANASIGEIVARFASVIQPKEMPAPVSQITNDDILGNIFSMVAEKTGFPREGIKPEFRLLDDLNLDSIKAGALLAQLSRNYNLQGKLEPAAYANAQLSDITKAISALLGVSKSATLPAFEEFSDAYHWVRSFSVEVVAEPLIIPATTKLNGKGRLLIVYSESSSSVIATVTNQLEKDSVGFDAIPFDKLNQAPFDASSRLIVLMPEYSGNPGLLGEAVALLATVARESLHKSKEMGFIQYGDGHFSRSSHSGEMTENIVSAVSFASSLHLERPDVKIRVMEIHKSIDSSRLTRIVHDEFNSGDAFVAAGYDEKAVRSQMFYNLARTQSVPRMSEEINENDVVLVTGGAKGITAECALALAQKYHCKMALVGSSAMNPEIGKTLHRYTGLKLTANYYSCDITSRLAVEQLLNLVYNDLGKITVLFHGAGMNIPRRAEQVSPADAMKEIAPKLMGALNLLECMKEQHLKYFIAFTSIIGVTGMQGNSWYAFSNETVDLLLRRLHHEKGTETLSLAYSVWSQVGMGQRMGSTKVLAGMGIGAITPEKGVEEFLHWVGHQSSDQQIVVAARLGGLDTWKRKNSKILHRGRYLSGIQYYEPGVELVARPELSRKSDRYTDDHNYNGSLLFPTVFGLEAMAQAAACVAGIHEFHSLRMEHISLLKPIVVPDQGIATVQVRAVVILNPIHEGEPVRIRTGISTEQSGFTEDHFSAEFIFNTIHEPETSNIRISLEPLPVEPESDLYTWLLFQGKTFRNIDKIYDLNGQSVVFSTKTLDDDTSGICLSGEVVAPFILGSPLFRDMLLQSAQMILTKQVYLPIRIEQWDIYDIHGQGKGGFIACNLTGEKDSIGTFDVTYMNNCQLILERITGYEVKALKPTPHFPSPEAIADPLKALKMQIKDGFEQLGDHVLRLPDWSVYKHSELFNWMNSADRHALEQKVFSGEMVPVSVHHLNNAEHKLSWENNGKPLISGSELSVSVSHSRSVLFLTAGPGLQGCDIEFVEERTLDDCVSLIGDQHKNLFYALLDSDKDKNLAVTRIWSVLEAFGKALGRIPEAIRVDEIIDQSILFAATLGEKHLQIATFPVTLWPGQNMVVAVSVEPKPKKVQYDLPEHGSLPENIFDPESGKFIHSFFTSFKDCNGFFGRTYFTDFPVWMGHLRELALNPIGRELVRDLGTGKFGMVTNASSVRIFNEAEALNKIVGKIWVTENSDFNRSYIDLNFEWFKSQASGELVKLAESSLSTTWVTIEGHGIVKQSPIPSYLLDFLKEHPYKGSGANGFPVHPYLSLHHLGKITYESVAQPRPDILWIHKTFQTGMYDGNSVGNLYYSNYYDWQAKTIEQTMFRVVPEVFKDNGKSGEFICLESVVNHLQEAMPFEEIGVDLYIEKLYENGMKLFFEYYSLGTTGKRKLAFGHNVLVWARRSNDKAIPLACPLPDKLLNFFKNLDRKLSVLSMD